MVFICSVRESLRARATLARNRSRIIVALLLAATFLMCSSAARAGDLDKVIAFNIAPQALDKALLDFGAQAHLQVMFAWSPSTAMLRTHGLKGSYTGREALARILNGTQLRYIAQGNTLEILPQAVANQIPTAQGAKSSSARPSIASRHLNHFGGKNIDPPVTDPSSRSREALAEIVVTAQKYRQSAFDVPISLDVIAAQDLQRLNITSLNDLQYDVPGMYVEGGSVNQYIVLRGVSNSSGNGAIVGQYIDEADISAEGYVGQVGYGTGDVQLYDLERVEVLKGPQGTLYGDGALGGVIRYISNKPALDSSQLSADVSTLFTQSGSPSQRIETMLNAPLIAGTFGLRVAGQFQHDGGWVDDPIANQKNINDLNLTDVRIEALWQPSTRFKALATQVIHREAYGIGAGEDADGNINPVYGITSPPNGDQSLNLSNLTMTADLARAQLLSSSTYLSHSEAEYNQSYTLTGEVELLHYLPIANQTFSEELRLHSVTHGPWHWTLGGLYKHESNRDDYGSSDYFGPPGPFSTASYYYIVGTNEGARSEAVFGDTSISVLDQLTFGAGVRYFRSRFSVADHGSLFDNVLIIPPNRAQEDFTSTDPRFYLQYHAARDVNIYASAAKGFRSGEPNVGLFQGFNPESLWSYDLGVKTRFLGGRVVADADAFYEKYSNYVGEGLVTIYGIPTFGTFNIGAARIKGADAEITWRATDRWKASAKGELVTSKFVSITAGDTGFVAGERLPFVPSYTFMGAVEREFHWDERPGFVQFNYSQTARVQGFSSPVIDSDVIRFLNFRTGVQWSGYLSLAFFAQNLLNERGHLDPYWNEAAAYRPRPRTFGIDFGITL